MLEQLRARGAELVSVSLPSTPLALGAYYVIASAEACSNLARYDGIRYGTLSSRACELVEDLTDSSRSGYRDLESEQAEERSQLYTKTRSTGFGKEVQKRLLLGTYALSAE